MNTSDNVKQQKNTLWTTFDKIIKSNDQDLMQENANVDGRSPMGMMGTFASERKTLCKRTFAF